MRRATRSDSSSCRRMMRSRACASPSRWRPRSYLKLYAPKDAVPYAIAFYAGLRRAEIDRLEWPELLDGQRIASRILVTRAKSESGSRAASTRGGAAARHPPPGVAPSGPPDGRQDAGDVGYVRKAGEPRRLRRGAQRACRRAKGERSRSDSTRTCVAQPKLAVRTPRQGAARCAVPSVRARRGDQDELPHRHDFQVRLHLALEVIDAHAERSGRFLSGDGVAGTAARGRVELVRT